MPKKYTMHVLSHTHWDREWYQPFQGYRRRLVHQMDAMMDLLEKRPEFKCFHLDGQTAVVSDYLEVRPESRKRLAKHIQSGRVLIGPWFVMPDEVLVSGESIVRNLLLGHLMCREIGAEPMPIGFVSDVFGHISQLPQIMAGFGIDSVFLHRGTGGDNRSSELLWEGADGTETLIVKAYPHTGYQDFMEYRDSPAEVIGEYERKKTALATTSVLFALDGNDHQPAKWDTPEAIARMNGYFERTRAVHSSMTKYLAELKKALGPDWQKGLKRFRGELHTPAHGGMWSEVFFGTGSARPPLKQANDRIEWLLARIAEPFHAWAVVLGGESQKEYLDLAWRYLLLNHPHDSICGCSQDQVHRDMMYRFDQARMLAGDVFGFAAQDIADRIDTSALAADDLVVTAFNASASPAGPVARFAFELPHDLAREKGAAGLAPALFDEAGKRVPMEFTGVKPSVAADPFMFKTVGATPAIRPRFAAVDRYHVAAVAQVGALGYRTLRIGFRPATRGVRFPRSPRPVRADAARGRLENEYLTLTVRRTGLVDLYDKTTRTTYKGLHFFEDCGDAGHGWEHRYPDSDVKVLSTSAKSRGKVTVSLDHQGRLSAAVKVALSLRVPADLQTTAAAEEGREAPKTARSRRLVTLPVETVFTVTAGSRRVDCRTTIENTARCHRLRVIFPTGRETGAWYGDSAFDLVKRDIELIDTAGWKERDREETHIKNLAAVSDDRAGLAVLTRGLNEAAVQDSASRSIALTLFRSFRQKLAGRTTADSLLLGRLVVEYAILPFTTGRGAPAAVLREADLYKLPLHSYTHPSLAGAAAKVNSELGVPNAIDAMRSPALKTILAARPKVKRNLPMAAGFLEVGAPFVLSTVKMSEDGAAVIVRLWNPRTRKAKALLRPAFKFRRAAKADMLEHPLAGLPRAKGGAVRLSLGPKEIATVRLELNK